MHAQGAMQSVLSVVVVCLSLAQKNATLEDISIEETLKPIDVSESAKIMTARSFEMIGNVHESCKLCILLATSINHTQYQCHTPCYAHAQTAGLLQSLARYKGGRMDMCVRGMCSPEL